MALERFGVSMDSELLSRFDERIRQAGYANRSEAIRDAVRNYLVREDWASGTANVVGTVTLVYDHHALQHHDELTDMQHEHMDIVHCTTHIHLDHHNCLEVVVLSGPADEVQQMADELISVKGVKHGRLTCTTTGEGM